MQNFPARGVRSAESHRPRVGIHTSCKRNPSCILYAEPPSPALRTRLHPKLGRSFPRVAPGIAEPLRMRASASVEGQPEGHSPRCTWFFILSGAAKVRGKRVESGGGVHAAPRLRADAPGDSIVAPESGFARPGVSEYISANLLIEARTTTLKMVPPTM